MPQDKKSFRHESLQDRDSIQALLKAITKGIAKGKVTLSDEDGDIALQPQGLLRFKLTAESDDNRHRIAIRISWQSEEENPERNKTLSVTGE